MIDYEPSAKKVAFFSLFRQRCQGFLRQRLRLIMIGLLVLLLLCPWLVIRWMEYTTPFESADVVLVGGIGGNLDAAIEYYQAGMVDKFLITVAATNRLSGEADLISVDKIIKERLLDKGVPEQDIIQFDRQPVNMLDKQRMLRDYFKKYDIHSYITFSRSIHGKFAKILHDNTFTDGDVKMVLVVSKGRGVWRKELLGIQNTLIRMAYWYFVCAPQIAND